MASSNTYPYVLAAALKDMPADTPGAALAAITQYGFTRPDKSAA